MDTLPLSNSFVSSPRYQTFRSASCAYQSYVSSFTFPSSVRTSCTTSASMPRIRFALFVTVTSARLTFPSASASRYTQRLPWPIGQYGLSMLDVKSFGSSCTCSLPSGSDVPEPPQAARKRMRAATARRMSAGYVGPMRCR